MIARIRSVKPSVFIHGLLFDIGELLGVGAAARLAYIGLWCFTDRAARFEWKPRELKAGVLPYDELDFTHILNAFANTGLVVRYVHAGRHYGWVPRFLDHQNINGRESDSALPPPPSDAVAVYEERLLASQLGAFTREQLIAEPPLATGPGVSAPRDGYVYYARLGAHVKIGFSRNPRARVRELSTARPGIKLVGYEAGDEALEHARHAQFAAHRIDRAREWFRWAPEIEEHVGSVHNIQRRDSLTVALDNEASASAPELYETAYDGCTDHYEDSGAGSVSDSNTNDLTRGSPDTPGREGKGIEGKGREGRTTTAMSSAGKRARPLKRAAPVVHDVSAVPGQGAVDNRSSATPDGTAAALGGVALAVVDDSARNVPALPAIRGRATALALRERMATVLTEVHDGTRTRMKREQVRRLNAELVFLYWQARFDHPNAILTPSDKRRARIEARLKENDDNVSELLYALDGAFHDDHIMARGRYEGETKYDGIDTVLRDRAQVEKFAARRKGFVEGKPHKALAKMLEDLTGAANNGNGNNGAGGAHDGEHQQQQ